MGTKVQLFTPCTKKKHNKLRFRPHFLGITPSQRAKWLFKRT